MRTGIHRRTHFTITEPLRKRFLNRVLRSDAEDCWPWLGAMRNGYGAIKHEKKVLSAHVVAWVLENGRMPSDGHIICHTCDNRVCCNPGHLYEGTFQDNVRDADRRRVLDSPRGEELPNAVLSEETVRRIWALRKVNGWGRTRIGRKLGIAEGTVDSVLCGQTWKHVSKPDTNTAKYIVSKMNGIA